MIVQCPQCKELIPLHTFSASDDVLQFECSACKRTVQVRPQTVAPVEKPVETEPEQPMARPAFSAPATIKPREAALWKSWEAVTASWEVQKAHESFVALCMTAGALPFAGTRYREALQSRPDDAMAKKGRDRVLAQAMVVAQATRDDGEDARVPSQTWKRVATGTAIFLMVAAMLWMMRSISHTAASLSQ